MNRLSTQDRAKIIGCLVEGNSVRATARLLDVDKKTVLRLLAQLGSACKAFHDKNVRNLKSRRIQCDEIWSFCYSKQANVPEEMRGEFGFGDVWTWTALDSDSKVIVSYRVDRRDEEAAYAFIADLRSRLAERVQLTTDGFSPYLPAVEELFGGDVDYAMLVKNYRANPADGKTERRYSPGKFVSASKRRISGNPWKQDVSTSHVERQNLSMRMGMRRFTRLTNAFSKKVENHSHAIAIYFLHYNFCRIHQTLRVTPAMQAGLTDHVWTLEEVAKLSENPAICETTTV